VAGLPGSLGPENYRESIFTTWKILKPWITKVFQNHIPKKRGKAFGTGIPGIFVPD